MSDYSIQSDQEALMQNATSVRFPDEVCVIVPTYNNEKTLEKVISGVLKYTGRIIVVNDGSTDRTREIIRKFPQLTAIHFTRNKGKGLAIQTGFREAMEQGFEYAITIDSDGQHRPDDLPRFVEKLEYEPGALIIGARNLDQEGIPGGTTFGNKFSNFWTWLETGYRLPDTQSGFRLYPLEPFRRSHFATRRFEFEIEVLVRAAWKGVRLVSVPVGVIYPPKGERVSHFRPFTDFFRISVLNSVLVILGLLFYRPRMLYRKVREEGFRDLMRRLLSNPGESNFRKAASVAVGVFMGIVPLWGWQMVAALAVAFVLRLNKTITLIASNISIPPMIPFILFGSYLTGGIVMDNPRPFNFDTDINLEFVKNNLVQYLIGAVVFGLILGLLAGLLTWLLLAIFRRRSKLPPAGE
jgi:glycosyltransferase involved in cell wall biosynthesis